MSDEHPIKAIRAERERRDRHTTLVQELRDTSKSYYANSGVGKLLLEAAKVIEEQAEVIVGYSAVIPRIDKLEADQAEIKREIERHTHPIAFGRQPSAR